MADETDVSANQRSRAPTRRDVLLAGGATAVAAAHAAAAEQPRAAPATEMEMPVSSADEFAAAYGFSPAVRAGGLLFSSGQVGFDRDGTAPTDPERQYRLAFAALGEVLKANGCSAADLVELLTFHTSYPQHMEIFMKVKAGFLGGARPTWTAIGVAALGTPTTLVEIKAVARAA